MSLDRDTIVASALDLLDEVGLDDFTTRRLGAALDISGPSLYWHFANKGEILDAMGERLLREGLPPPDFTSDPFDWAAWLEKGARGIRQTALSRRDGARLIARLSTTSPAYVRGFQANVECLMRAGFSVEDARKTLACLGRFAVGWVLYEQAVTASSQKREMSAGFEFGLETFMEGLKAKLHIAPLARGSATRPSASAPGG